MKRLFLFLCVSAFASGCASYENDFRNDREIASLTEDKKAVAFAMADRFFFSEENDDGSHRTKFELLQVVDLEKKVLGMCDVYDQALGFENEELTRYVDEFNLRADFEHGERVCDDIAFRVKTVRLFYTLQEYLGVGSRVASEEYSKYHIGNIFLPSDLESAYPFSFQRLEDARARNLLSLVDRAVWLNDRMFDRKAPDPARPNDPNAFVWKPFTAELEVSGYKILDMNKPEENFLDYLEGYRVVNGVRESKPALKIFFPQNNQSGVMVLDLDQEGKLGFGLPDVVERVSVSSAQVVVDNQSLRARLFAETEEERRVRPITPPLRVEIARIGEPLDVWEHALDPGGWQVPFNFKNDLGDNFNVRLKIEETDSPMQLLGRIEYIAKEWTSGSRFSPSVGAVLEFFKPKAPFGGENILSADIRSEQDTKRIVIVFEDGTEQSGFVTPANNIFIENEPFAVEYTEGQRRWRFEKDPGSDVFNKRRQVTPPETQIGRYD